MSKNKKQDDDDDTKQQPKQLQQSQTFFTLSSIFSPWCYATICLIDGPCSLRRTQEMQTFNASDALCSLKPSGNYLLKWHSSYGFLPNAKTAHTLTLDQGGGHKDHSAIGQALQLFSETEIIQLHQTLHINLFLDLQHCFEYMVEACHNMVCCHQGVADDYLQLHAQTHCLMHYYVWHKFGVSTDYNTFEQNPWHGAGQGAANAALWYITLLDVLINAYHEQTQPCIL